RLPPDTVKLIEGAERRTAANRKLVLTIALSYGSRQEIVAAAQAAAAECVAGRLSPEAIDEQCFAGHLYTADMPDPDLLIRTSGEQRISNFLLWQLAYTELVFTDTLWPDFGQAELEAAIATYRSRERRYGAVTN
ncbi:MAG: polyprenyl diphosphate synthase, partial [Reyranella sp.]